MRCSTRTAEALLKIEAATGKKADIVVMVQGDEPMVRPEMIDAAIAPIVSSGRAAGLLCKLWDRHYGRIPDFLILEGPEAGGHLGFSRQDLDAPPSLSDLLREVLTAIAETLISKICCEGKGASLRGVALMSPEAPELARAIYEAGPGESVRRIAAWLSEQDRLGLLSVPDPAAAAEMFAGMVLGHGHLRAVLGLPHPEEDDAAARARETARRFIRAFAPD